jgi:hypothetical protein
MRACRAAEREQAPSRGSFAGWVVSLSPPGFLRAYLVWLGFCYPVCKRTFTTSCLSVPGASSPTSLCSYGK